MKHLQKLILAIIVIAISGTAHAQVAFSNKNIKLSNANFHSGCTVAIVDWNFDGLDDIIRLDDGRNAYVEVQRTNNTFQSLYIGSFSTTAGWSWGMCVADFDHNGYLDITAGGYGPAVKIMMTDAAGLMGSIISLPNTGFFVQNMTCADFNNDGWIDLFSCDDNAMSHIFLNNGSGSLTESLSTINFDVTGTDDSGNYGSVWTDFDNDGDMDLYIAKCRQGVNNPADGRRINVMFVNDGSNNYTESAATYGINMGWQSWTASFGDIDNDGDLDLLVTNHDYVSQILENDGSGHYTDITATTGFDISDITPIESAMEDFDNDGFVDLLIAGSDQRFYHNNGDKTFTRVEGLFDSNNLESFAIGDINHDGKIDIYGSYANIYTDPTIIDDVVWTNNTHNDNHFVTLNLIGTVSNKGAIGARANVYGAWGNQIREVRSGESYGTVNSSMLHFGLGAATVIDSIVVRFPSGITQTIVNPQADQFIRIIENDCVSPEPGLTYSQSAPVICTGNTETITAAAGLSYVWSDGSTGQTLNITAGGEYNVILTAPGNNCIAVSPTLVIEQDPIQTPAITANGELEFCDGSTVDLTINDTYGISSYNWSSGATTPSINVNQSGTYTLTVQGYCAQYTSNPITVVSHLVPTPVTQTTVSLPAPGPATLTATGTIINWYDAVNATTPVYTGASYTTPSLSTTTDFWVENSEKYNAGIANTGLTYFSGANPYSSGTTTNAHTYFDVAKPCILQTVKVYTDVAGTRRIELRNSQNTLLQYADVMISPDTQVVALNFNLVPGTNYSLGTNDSVNQAIPGWGNTSPRLKRNNGGVTYPYTLADAVSITGNDFGGQYYYYFYDWSVEKIGLTCSSSRVQVTVDITTGIQDLTEAGISMFPNPTNDVLNIRLDNNTPVIMNIYDATGRLMNSNMLQQSNNIISVATLHEGMYQVELIKDGKHYQQKLVIY